MKNLISTFLLVSSTFLFSFNWGASISNPETSAVNSIDNNFDYDWLKELESQIITESQEAQEKNSKIPTSSKFQDVPNIGKPSASDTPANEPLVVTVKSYLTGQDSIEYTVTESASEIDELPLTESPIIHTTKQDSRSTHIDPARAKLDKILVDIATREPRTLQLGEISANDGSEVGNFLNIVRSQTSVIILISVMSLLVLFASILSVYKVIKTCNEHSAITLISHYEFNEEGEKVERVEKRDTD